MELNGTQTHEDGRRAARLPASSGDRDHGQGLGGAASTSRSAPANNNHPRRRTGRRSATTSGLGQLTQVLNNRALNEVKVGYAYFILDQRNLTTWSNHWQRGQRHHHRLAAHLVHRVQHHAATSSIRATRTVGLERARRLHFSYDARGRHDLRAGGEFLDRYQIQANCRQCMGIVDARGGPRPTPASSRRWFPDAFNADTWNLAAISPITRSYRSASATSSCLSRRRSAPGCRTTGGSGRADAESRAALRPRAGAVRQRHQFLPLQEAGRPNDTNNIQPRLGFAYQLNDRTVIRGGSGLYYGDALGGDQSFARGNVQIAVIQVRQRRPRRISPRTRSTGSRCRPTSRRSSAFCHVNGEPARLSDPRRAGGDRAARAWSACSDVADLDRFPAAVRLDDRGRGGLRLQQGHG